MTTAAKWQQAGLPSEIFHNHPSFAHFIAKSDLFRQIRLTKDVAIQMLDLEPKLHVNGRWMGLNELRENFEVHYSSQFKQNFVIHKKDRHVYTYLGNGQGLQPYHPYLSDPLPIEKLTPEQYNAALEKGRQFQRPGEAETESQARNQDRRYVLQVVTVMLHGGHTHFQELLTNPRHVFPRLITPDGNVLEEALVLRNKALFPLTNMGAQLCSLDPWNMSDRPKDFHITNIAISQEEAEKFQAFCQKYRRDSIQLGRPINFHWTDQNCSVFTREACREAGITIPTEMAIRDVVAEITPDWIRKVSLFFQTVKEGVFQWMERKISKRLTEGLRQVSAMISCIWQRTWQILISIFTFPIRLCLGDGTGKFGVMFAGVQKTLENPARFCDFRLNLPAVVQRWQKDQASTFVIRNPVKLAVV
ncbi:MAG: hypothetical protein HY069_00850 [Chlamydiia bacterium]|nr:hypothetical protein [Chlamydiia bacterium]